MKGFIWLTSGLLLSLLLVSVISVKPQFFNFDNLSVTQDLKMVNRLSGQALGQMNQGFDSQLAALNNSTTVISVWEIISSWWTTLINWLKSFWLKPELSLDSAMELKGEGTRYGLMVVPSTGSTTKDEWLKKNLSQIFADQVDLRFDENGQSGVVTPIFRDGRRGGDYLFILTPLR